MTDWNSTEHVAHGNGRTRVAGAALIVTAALLTAGVAAGGGGTVVLNHGYKVSFEGKAAAVHGTLRIRSNLRDLDERLSVGVYRTAAKCQPFHCERNVQCGVIEANCHATCILGRCRCNSGGHSESQEGSGLPGLLDLLGAVDPGGVLSGDTSQAVEPLPGDDAGNSEDMWGSDTGFGRDMSDSGNPWGGESGFGSDTTDAADGWGNDSGFGADNAEMEGDSEHEGKAGLGGHRSKITPGAKARAARGKEKKKTGGDCFCLPGGDDDSCYCVEGDRLVNRKTGARECGLGATLNNGVCRVDPCESDLHCPSFQVCRALGSEGTVIEVDFGGGRYFRSKRATYVVMPAVKKSVGQDSRDAQARLVITSWDDHVPSRAVTLVFPLGRDYVTDKLPRHIEKRCGLLMTVGFNPIETGNRMRAPADVRAKFLGWIVPFEQFMAAIDICIQ